MPGLDPNQTSEEIFHDPEAVEKRHALTTQYNYFEPPFPWAVEPFNPGVFNLAELPDPLDWGGRGVILT